MRRIALAVLLVCTVLVVPVAAHTNHVEADAQRTHAGVVSVESAYIASDGWVVLHADDNGDIGQSIGHRSLDSDAGHHADTPVRINRSVWADWSGTRRVWVTLHTDDGDGQFEPEQDDIIEQFGERAAVRVAVERGADAYVAALGFAPQETDDASVSVRTVRIPADGELVVRNASADGRVVGRTAIDAGNHSGVTVSLDESFYRVQSQSFTLHASLVTDGTPVRAGEQRVATTFPVSKATTATPTATVTPTQSETGPGTATDSATPAETPETGTAPSTSQPGFGLLAVLASLLVAARVFSA